MKTKNIIAPLDKFRFNFSFLLYHFVNTGFTHRFFEKTKKEISAAYFSKQKNKGNKIALDCYIKNEITNKQLFENYIKTGKPVVVKGFASNWIACKKWSLTYFNEVFGEEKVLSTDMEGISGIDLKGDFQVSVLKEFFKKDKTNYLRFSPLINQNESLKKDLNLNLCKELSGKSELDNNLQLFIGNKNHTRMHTEILSNFYLMIHGRKKWRLFEHSLSPILNCQTNRSVYVYSSYDLNDLQCAEKLLPSVNYYDVDLEEGDLLYMPPFLWHQVENLTDFSIGVGYRFTQLSLALKRSALFSLFRFTSMNPPFWKSMKYSKKDTSLILAHHFGTVKDIEKDY